MEAYDAGQRDFGENKAQDLVAKQQALPRDIRWHFTGHLQSNKIKYIVDRKSVTALVFIVVIISE